MLTRAGRRRSGTWARSPRHLCAAGWHSTPERTPRGAERRSGRLRRAEGGRASERGEDLGADEIATREDHAGQHHNPGMLAKVGVRRVSATVSTPTTNPVGTCSDGSGIRLNAPFTLARAGCARGRVVSGKVTAGKCRGPLGSGYLSVRATSCWRQPWREALKRCGESQREPAGEPWSGVWKKPTVVLAAK